MRAKFCLSIALLAIHLIFFAQTVFAFGDKGHQLIAAMAYSQLTPTAKTSIDRLLALDRALDQDSLTEKDFISCATWADEYRDSDRNTSKIRYKATRNWHFVDLELDHPNLKSACTLRKNLGLGRLATQGEDDDCIVDKLEQFIAELKNPAIPQFEKIAALKFVLHFVGDLHQPLHAANHNDRGGNQLTVRFTKQNTGRTNTTNLHSYWDHQAIDDLGKKTFLVIAQLNADISQAEKNNWVQGDIRTWAMESNRLAKESVYDFKGLKQFKDKEGRVAYVLSENYQARATEIIAIQLQKASVRLAIILNDVFDSQNTRD